MLKLDIDQDSGTLHIKDDLKIHHQLLVALMVLNFINAVLNLYNTRDSKFGLLEYIWILLASVSLFFFFYYFKRKTTLEKIKLSDIVSLEKYTKTENFYLILKNGKRRDLMTKNPDDVLELTRTLTINSSKNN